MPNFEVSAGRAYGDHRFFIETDTKELALRSFVSENHAQSLDLLDYSKPIWLVENGGSNGAVGFFNGETKDDVRASYAKDLGFPSLAAFTAWEHEKDREMQLDRRLPEDIEVKENDEVETIDVSLVELFDG